jgi:cytochrome c oxidase assembly protein subunit 15
MASVFPGLRLAAPRLSIDFFVCHQCMKYSRSATRTLKTNFSQSIRFNSSAAATPKGLKTPKTNTSKNSTPLLKSLGKINSNAAGKALPKSGFFPKTSSNTVAYWLLGSAASVFGIVVFGGLTRLTESGYIFPDSQIPPLQSHSSDKDTVSASQNGNP